jgi:hypoxanthine phosphoribosyltransferase
MINLPADIPKDMVTIHDKVFEPFLSSLELSGRVDQLAIQINRDYEAQNPIFVVVLNGAFMFASDLLKKITIPCEVSFVKVSSYTQMGSSGTVKELVGLNRPVNDRQVIVVEDIVDTGLTMSRLVKQLSDAGARDVHVATLLHKPAALQLPLQLRYVGFEIENRFVVGYGLDYDEQGRNLDAIYVLAP